LGFPFPLRGAMCVAAWLLLRAPVVPPALSEKLVCGLSARMCVWCCFCWCSVESLLLQKDSCVCLIFPPLAYRWIDVILPEMRRYKVSVCLELVCIQASHPNSQIARKRRTDPVHLTTTTITHHPPLRHTPLSHPYPFIQSSIHPCMRATHHP